MFFGLVTNNLQVFLISSEILVKMSTLGYPLFYYFIMITRAMDLLHLDFVKCSSSGSHQGLCFLMGYSKAVSGNVCVLQWGHLLFSCRLCSLFFPSSQFPIIMFNLFSLSFNILIMRHLVCV